MRPFSPPEPAGTATTATAVPHLAAASGTPAATPAAAAAAAAAAAGATAGALGAEAGAGVGATTAGADASASASALCASASTLLNDISMSTSLCNLAGGGKGPFQL